MKLVNKVVALEAQIKLLATMVYEMSEVMRMLYPDLFKQVSIRWMGVDNDLAKKRIERMIKK